MFKNLATITATPQDPSQITALYNALVNNLKSYGPGLLNGQTTSVGNAADTTDDTLHTFTLPANFLAGIGTNSGLRITAWGTTAANGNDKRFRLLFGTTVISSGTVTINAKNWWAQLLVLRSGVSTQSVCGLATSDAVDIATYYAAGTEDETAAITIKSTGASQTTGAANDVVGKGFLVEVIQ